MTPPKPSVQALSATNIYRIPQELQTCSTWVLWQLDPPLKDSDKWRKVPYQIDGRHASTTDPATWSDFGNIAASHLRSPEQSAGIGFVFVPSDGFIGVDLDQCIQGDGQITPEAQRVVDLLNSYTEYSASGTGLHIICQGIIPEGKRRVGHIEMYAQGRYFTMTGRPISDRGIEERTAQLAQLHSSYFDKPVPKPSSNGHAHVSSTSLSLADTDLLSLARRAKNGSKLDLLWAGNWETLYSSQSEADLALLGILRFYSQDSWQLDRLFRQSGLMRDKWDEQHGEQTYGQKTINYALAGVTETYTPPATANLLFSGGNETTKADDDSTDVLDGVAQWPNPIDEKAYYGILGEMVHLVEPTTEADPVAILGQMLVGFGNLIGRGPHFTAEKACHYTNLDLVLVGATAKGRKGSSWAQVLNILREIDEDWTYNRVISGLSSGEGLIWAVRNPIVKREMVKEKGKQGEYRDVEIDPGISDKRCLVVEGEFTTALKSISRQGNTLSSVMRQAWDDGNLNTLVKNAAARATNAHISIIGHVTKGELLRDMTETETSNGFANRIIWLCSKRSKLLPDGYDSDGLDFGPVVSAFRSAADFATTIPEMRRDDQARELWHSVYGDLSEGKTGLFGMVTSRAEAQVMRIACLYALLDRSAWVRLPHLEAALALWQYSEESCRWIFGFALGDSTADQILEALKSEPAGMTRTQIRQLFSGHKESREISTALALLLSTGLALRTKQDTAGRPTETWTASVTKRESAS